MGVARRSVLVGEWRGDGVDWEDEVRTGHCLWQARFHGLCLFRPCLPLLVVGDVFA